MSLKRGGPTSIRPPTLLGTCNVMRCNACQTAEI